MNKLADSKLTLMLQYEVQNECPVKVETILMNNPLRCKCCI